MCVAKRMPQTPAGYCSNEKLFYLKCKVFNNFDYWRRAKGIYLFACGYIHINFYVCMIVGFLYKHMYVLVCERSLFSNSLVISAALYVISATFVLVCVCLRANDM